MLYNQVKHLETLIYIRQMHNGPYNVNNTSFTDHNIKNLQTKTSITIKQPNSCGSSHEKYLYS